MAEPVSETPKCWWCGEPATTGEHKVKRSDLARMLNHSSGGPLVLAPPDERPAFMQGPNSKFAKFPKSMCAPCNNARSAPFDRAYDLFSSAVWSNPERFRARWLDLQEIFGPDPLPKAADTARYFIKNFACRLAEAGMSVPQDFLDFLNDDCPFASTMDMVLFTDFSCYDQFRRTGADEQGSQHEFANRVFHPEDADQPLRLFAGEIMRGPVGVYLRWDPSVARGFNFFSQRRIPLRDRRELPHPELHETEWDRASMMARVLDSGAFPAKPDFSRDPTP